MRSSLRTSRATAPSPPQVLLEALAGCVSVDVVLILQKKRTPATAISCEITAERADAVPRRLTKVHLHYRISGDNIPLANAERSIELAVTKYCTVRDKLDPARGPLVHVAGSEVAGDLAETPSPTAEELRLIREELDPEGMYSK